MIEINLFLKNFILILWDSITKPRELSVIRNGRVLKPEDETLSLADKSGKPANSDNKKQTILVQPGFKAALIAVVFLTLVFFLIAVGLAFIQNPTEQQKQIFALCTNLTSSGFGGVVGLIGGKTSK